MRIGGRGLVVGDGPRQQPDHRVHDRQRVEHTLPRRLLRTTWFMAVVFWIGADLETFLAPAEMQAYVSTGKFPRLQQFETALVYLALGTFFGFVLSRSGAADYNYIQAMFLFEHFQLYGIIGTAVALAYAILYVADFDAAAAMVQQAIDTFGGLDILVTNAGFVRDRMLVNTSEEEWDSVIRVHLKGHFAPSRWAVQHWRDRAKAGEEVHAGKHGLDAAEPEGVERLGDSLTEGGALGLDVGQVPKIVGEGGGRRHHARDRRRTAEVRDADGDRVAGRRCRACEQGAGPRAVGSPEGRDRAADPHRR